MPYDDSITIADHDELIKPCRYWVKKLSGEEHKSLAHSVDKILADWRALQRSQQVDIPMFRDPAGPDGYDLDVAFKLWADDDPGFSEVIAEYGLPTVFAVIGSASLVSTTSALARLNGLLVGLILDRLEGAELVAQYYLKAHGARREKQRTNVKEAQRIAAEKRKEKAIQVRMQYRQAAYKYMVNNPAARQDALLDHLQSLELEKVNRPADKPADKQPKRGTIKRLIAGVMEEARKASRPALSLYATEQKRNR